VGLKFWIKRALQILILGFSLIFIAQYFKSNNIWYSFTQAGLWATISTSIYLLVLRYKLRKNPVCAVKGTESKN